MALRSPAARFTSLDEFEALLSRPGQAERLLELIDGEVVEKVPTEQHGLIAVNIASELRAFVKERGLGRVTVEVRYQIPRDDQDPKRPRSLIPDVAFTSQGRTLPVVTGGSVMQLPDLAVEIQSPDQSDWMMSDKAAYYLANGSRMVWLIYPDRQLVEVLTSTTRRLLTATEAIEGGELLPGFQLPVREVFAE